jgi:NADH:ubiquinone oxidoreductase subunit E
VGRLNVVVCRGPTCGEKRGSAALTAHLQETIAARGLDDRVSVSEEICLGHCLRGPNILVGDADHPDGLTSPRVIERHLLGGIAVRALTNLPPVRDR